MGVPDNPSTEQNRGGMSPNGGRIRQDAGGIVSDAWGIRLNGAGNRHDAGGIRRNARGISSNGAGISLNARGIRQDAGAIRLNAPGISLNARAISLNAGSFLDLPALPFRDLRLISHAGAGIGRTNRLHLTTPPPSCKLRPVGNAFRTD